MKLEQRITPRRRIGQQRVVQALNMVLGTVRLRVQEVRKSSSDS